MTYKQVASMIESTGLPNAYRAFTEETAKPCPFITFFYVDSDDVYADDQNYQNIPLLCVELYTDFKDFDLEIRIEKIFSDNGLTYYKEENFIESEKMYQIAYEMEVIINGEQG